MPIVRGKDIEVLFSASAIARRNLELAKEIAGREYHDLLVISVLKGSFIFAADLIRAMHDAGIAPEVEFDDILESGKTLQFARNLMLSRGAKSCSLAVLLDKRMRRKTDLEADYVGFDCPDHFVVGYGMDVGHAFRELPFVGIVKGDA
jgi:hypoxanthine phosphoribosyltransferase